MGQRHAQKQRLRESIAELKSDPCADCGGRFPAVAMDFDHVSGDKVGGVSQLVREGASLSRVVAEIDKCELVCANCHRIRTAERLAEF